jgi:penicillin-binding protein 2
LLRDDVKFVATKIAVFQYFAVAVFLFLVSGFWVLQVREYEANSEAADRNHIKAVPLLAPRGKILDRDGRVIVDNHSTFKVMLTRENLKPEHLEPIARGLNLDPDDLRARVRRFASRPKYVPVMIKEQLTDAELSFVVSHRDPDTFPEMEMIRSQQRLYPRGGLAAHVIGYVGEVSEEELNQADFAHYAQGDVIGKSGLEREYNDILMGVDGQRRVVVDNRGNERQVLNLKEATSGKNLQLTIDLDLQVVAELAMDGRRGAVVALDPRSGEVLAMVSRPSYDPNLFAGRIRAQDWNALMTDPYKPLLNRAIQAQLAPGSTFKPFVALAGLENETIDDHFGVRCGGGATFYGRYFKCHLKGGHGGVELHKGIVQSCDVYFYNVGNRTHIDKIAEMAQMSGLGKKTGIDLPHEAEGLIPSTKWALRTERRKWYAGETISVAVGQGAVTVTPIQLAYSYGGLAMGGVWFQPHLVKTQKLKEPIRRPEIHAENIAKVVYGLYGVVNEGGTAARSRIPGVELCGKTGTAQVASNDLVKLMKGNKGANDFKDNAWFVGFAPRENPEIVVAALFESGEHGNWAAPIVRDVVKAYFDKKARQAAPKQDLALIRRPQ